MKRIRIAHVEFAVGIVIALLTAVGSGCASGVSRRQYYEFGRALNQVKDGMSRAQVIALLGQPTRAERDAAIWEVSSEAGGTTVYVHFDKDGQVYHVTKFPRRRLESRPWSSRDAGFPDRTATSLPSDPLPKDMPNPRQ